MILETFCRIYLDNDQEIEILETVKKLQEVFNQYMEILDNSGIKHFNKFLSLGDVFEITQEGKAEIKMESIKSIYSWKKRQEAYFLERNERNQKRLSLRMNCIL